MIISAFRSLGREFSGIVVKKSSTPGLSSDQHWLYLLPESVINTEEGSRAIINALANDEQLEHNILLHRVGVSSVVYAEASTLSQVEKQAFSPVITIQSRKFIDLGIYWFIFGIMGLILSCWMYYQTLKKPPDSQKYEPEEIDVPGL
ncbi:MAG: hypothetical protein Kow0029_18930 [Candidatus Rifleibacteriota bacterium]